MADDDPNNPIQQEYDIIEDALEKAPYVVRHYDQGEVRDAFLRLFSQDEVGERLSSEFCKHEIRGDTLSIHAVEAQGLTLLYDEDSYYDESGDRMSFAAFAFLTSKGPTLYVDMLCTSKESRDANKRYGEAMLRSIESYAKEKGYETVELDSIPSATGFYKKMGYTQFPGGESGALMRKSLKTGGRKTRRRKITKRKV